MEIYQQEMKLIESRTETPRVKRFKFEKPDQFVHRAGQYTRIGIDGTMKAFSIVSSPDEPFLEFASVVKDRSAFKEKLSGLDTGSTVDLGPILGDLVFRPGMQKVGIVTGGIGITPFVSMLRYIAQHDRETEVALFYSAKTEEEIAFRSELEAFARELPNMKLVVTLTDDDWGGETGRIDKAMIVRHVEKPEAYDWMIAGPPKMVDSLQTTLAEEMKLPSVKTEDFNGY